VVPEARERVGPSVVAVPALLRAVPLAPLVPRAILRCGSCQRIPIVVEWLPGYAPELDAVEYVWGHTKYGDLACHWPEGLAEMSNAVDGSPTATSTGQSLLRGFVRATGLAAKRRSPRGSPDPTSTACGARSLPANKPTSEEDSCVVRTATEQVVENLVANREVVGRGIMLRDFGQVDIMGRVPGAKTGLVPTPESRPRHDEPPDATEVSLQT